MAATTASSFFIVFLLCSSEPSRPIERRHNAGPKAGRRRVAANTRVDGEQGEMVGAGRLALEQHVAERRPRGAAGHAKGIEPHAQWANSSRRRASPRPRHVSISETLRGPAKSLTRSEKGRASRL